MKKRVALTVLGLVLVIVVLGGIKALQIGKMIEAGENFVLPPETITVAEAARDTWSSGISAVGSVEAIRGVDITAELPGKIVEMPFEPGRDVARGALLVRQDTSTEEAQLRGARSARTLAGIDLERTRELLSRDLASQSDLDNAEARFEEAEAAVQELEAVIAKKTIRAPFAGRLGIRRVSPGEVVGEGEVIVPLNALDPIFVDFSLPQQHLPHLRTGLEVEVTSSAVPDRVFRGTVTAMDSGIDPSTRNLLLQATVDNPETLLRPGMFVRVTLRLGGTEDVLMIPLTAVLNAPYGDQVFVVTERPADPESGAPAGLYVEARFVRLGERRGDFVAVTSGLQPGDRIASTGAFKLRNGAPVVINNELSPPFATTPSPENQ